MANEILAKLIGSLISSSVGNDPNALANKDFNPNVTPDEFGNYIDSKTGEVVDDSSALNSASPYNKPTWGQRTFSPEMAQQAEGINFNYRNSPILADQSRDIRSQDVSQNTQDILGRAGTEGAATGATRLGLFANGTLNPEALNTLNTVDAKIGANTYPSIAGAETSAALKAAQDSTAGTSDTIASNLRTAATNTSAAGVNTSASAVAQSDLDKQLAQNRDTNDLTNLIEAQKAQDRAAKLKSYTDVYNSGNIPGQGSIMGHVNDLGDLSWARNPLANPINGVINNSLGSMAPMAQYARQPDGSTIKTFDPYENLSGDANSQSSTSQRQSEAPQPSTRAPIVDIPNIIGGNESTESGSVPSAISRVKNAMIEHAAPEGELGLNALTSGKNVLARLLGGTTSATPTQQGINAAKPTTPADVINYKKAIGLPITSKDLNDLKLWQQKNGRPAIGQLITH